MVEEGRRYGLELNWSKTVQMQVSTASRVTQPNGENIKSVREAVYLGGLLTCDGRAVREITRRIGEASRSFSSLESVWKSGSVSTDRKVQIYQACIVSKVM